MTMRARSLAVRAALAAALLMAPAVGAAAATISIVNLDPAGVGFNDTTPAAPVGGNTGTTIGQQRLNVFTAAANIWGALLPSAVAINVGAQWTALTCTATSAVLGSAGPFELARDFPGAEIAGTWYHIALANKMAGVDLDPANYDIAANFNVNLGQTGCLTGIFFYYGLDHNPGTNVDLLAVLLHELAHGLGFSSTVNLSTGSLLSGFPGAYDRHLLDDSIGLHWDAMTDGQRATSAVNTDNVVWDGTATRAKSATFLGPRKQIVVNSPAGLAGIYRSGSANFGAALTAPGVTASLVLADDGTAPNSDACSPLVNAAAVAGNICVVDRGTCSFVSKALAAQNAGAIGVIIVNNVAGPAPEMGGTDPTVTIPVASLSQTDGTAIEAQIGSGVNVTLRVSNALLQGADDSNRPLVYAPNPIQGGSSISHWDVSAFPNLLMEPIINPNLTTVDLTPYAFQDLGWTPHTTAVSPLAAPGTVLASNWPNPFSARTAISYVLPRPMSVDLAVYDLGGRLVKRLASSPRARGAQTAVWDGTDAAGRRMEPGVYLYRLRAGAQVESRRMVLLH